MHFTIDQNGCRSSTLTAFLPISIVKARQNHLAICTGTLVNRVEVGNKNGQIIAEGIWVQALDVPGTSRLVRARREVILAAGPINSPHILMLRCQYIFIYRINFLILI